MLAHRAVLLLLEPGVDASVVVLMAAAEFLSGVSCLEVIMAHGTALCLQFMMIPAHHHCPHALNLLFTKALCDAPELLTQCQELLISHLIRVNLLSLAFLDGLLQEHLLLVLPLHHVLLHEDGFMPAIVALCSLLLFFLQLDSDHL